MFESTKWQVTLQSCSLPNESNLDMALFANGLQWVRGTSRRRMVPVVSGDNSVQGHCRLLNCLSMLIVWHRR